MHVCMVCVHVNVYIFGRIKPRSSATFFKKWWCFLRMFSFCSCIHFVSQNSWQLHAICDWLWLSLPPLSLSLSLSSPPTLLLSLSPSRRLSKAFFLVFLLQSTGSLLWLDTRELKSMRKFHNFQTTPFILVTRKSAKQCNPHSIYVLNFTMHKKLCTMHVYRCVSNSNTWALERNVDTDGLLVFVLGWCGRLNYSQYTHWNHRSRAMCIYNILSVMGSIFYWYIALEILWPYGWIVEATQSGSYM